MKNVPFIIIIFCFLSWADPDQCLSQKNDSLMGRPVEKIYTSSGKIVLRIVGWDPSSLALKKKCQSMGIEPTYSSIYDKILIPLCNQGIKPFKVEDLVNDGNFDLTEIIENGGADWECYLYFGTFQQNTILLRLLDLNQDLFKHGKLKANARFCWKQ